MLQETVLRVDHLGSPIIVCNEDHRFLVAEQLLELGIKPAAIILEPVARNTAPAIALAALAACGKEPQSILVILPADHLIKDVASFRARLESAIELAGTGKLVTFGIRPERAETGYGYIKAVSKSPGMALEIQQFVEKPDIATAVDYFMSGKYYWNSGMFVFRADVYLRELETHQPDILKYSRQAFASATADLDFTRVDQEAFARCPEDSIDYAVMEKTDNAVLVPYDSDWSDLGSWQAIWEETDKDGDENVILGDVIAEDCTGSLFHAENHLIAAIGVEDMVIIDTKDALLIAKKDRVQDIKKIVDRLKAMERGEYLLHREVFRPWGSYDSIDAGDGYQVKRLTVKPGKSLSLQYHHKRSEHWVVVKGSALVQIGDEEKLVNENESAYIPKGVKHRLTNPGTAPIHLIEVQSGSYLGEDDIVRLEDAFGRT
jgi:mannose-1-phosphate guanylyltransferase/mannose-6-phosphate isomerase